MNSTDSYGKTCVFNAAKFRHIGLVYMLRNKLSVNLVPEEEFESEEEDDGLEEDYEQRQLSLVRTPSRSKSPPELIKESGSEYENESMPASPDERDDDQCGGVAVL